MILRPLAPLAAIAALLAAAPAASAAPAYVPGEVVVKYEGAETPVTRTVPEGATVRQAARRLEARDDVDYAVPNHIARAAGFVPNDPGRGGARNWRRLQWNFLDRTGVRALGAWTNLYRAGAPGGRGVTVAVIDTGVAYSTSGRFRRGPDFAASTFVRGYDFVAPGTSPHDEMGHGTFVAGLIAARTNNALGLTGLAFGAKIMPVRVLDEQGLGDAATIAKGIRYAARRGARVINLSLEFDSSVPEREVPEISSAVRYAYSRGAVIVAAGGNSAQSAIALPARASRVVSVAATTEHGCQADYSNQGRGLDLAAPGGGADAAVSEPGCNPFGAPGRDIYHLTFSGSPRRFGYHREVGTSMSAPHVSAAAALVIASGVVGARPSPAAVEQRLKGTARDLGPAGLDQRYGAGLIDAAAATRRSPPLPAR